MSIKTIRVTKHPMQQPIIRLVQGDANTQRIRFLVKKEYGGVNLYGLVWSVWVHGYGGEAEVSYIGSGTVSGDDIVLDWDVIPSATNTPGTTVLKLYGCNDGEDETLQAWTSGNMIVNVTPTQMIDPGYDEESVDTIRQLIIDFGNADREFHETVDDVIENPESILLIGAKKEIVNLGKGLRLSYSEIGKVKYYYIYGTAGESIESGQTIYTLASQYRPAYTVSSMFCVGTRNLYCVFKIYNDGRVLFETLNGNPIPAGVAVNADFSCAIV